MKRSRSYYSALAWTEACRSARAWVLHKKAQMDEHSELHQPAPTWGVVLLASIIAAALVFVAVVLIAF